MAWERVATAQLSNQGVQGEIQRSLEELPVGTLGRIKLEGWGIGPLMDAPGAEQIAQAVLSARGQSVTIVDCWGEGWGTGFIEFQGSPVAVVPLLWAIAAVLSALGFVIVVLTLALLIWQAKGATRYLLAGVLGLTALVGGWFMVKQLVRR